MTFLKVDATRVAATAGRNDGGLRSALHRFRRAEDGSLLIFGLFCFIMMLGLAGVALDLMRYEERRTVLQNTADRAVLAAADLNQTIPCKDVVKDYFVKGGLPAPSDSQINCQNGAFDEWREVTVAVSEDLPTWFMNMYGIPKLATPAAATAEERIGQVEISLVLDVSGSMDSNSRLINLKPAAKKFIDDMFDSVEEGKLSISIVPFNTQVSIGPDLIDYFNLDADHDFSYCLEFDPNDFKTTSLTTNIDPVTGNVDLAARKYKQNGHFDAFAGSSTYTPSPDFGLNCTQDRGRDILAFSGNRDQLKAYIDSFDAYGYTSIDLGMKWGAALLDPAMAPIVDDMIAAGTLKDSSGKVLSEFGDRPYQFSNQEALKVVVLMSDGANTTEYELQPDVDSGLSPLWRSNSTTYNGSTSAAQYSLWDQSRGQYYIFYNNTWRNEAWGDGTYKTCGTCAFKPDPGDAVQLSWQEVWDRMTVNWYARYIHGRAYGLATTNAWSSSWSPSNSVVKHETNKDAQTLDICTTFKSANNTLYGRRPQIYTIAFEAPTAGINVLRSCASSTTQFYNASGSTIGGTFTAIASSINKLRLTY